MDPIAALVITFGRELSGVLQRLSTSQALALRLAAIVLCPAGGSQPIPCRVRGYTLREQ